MDRRLAKLLQVNDELDAVNKAIDCLENLQSANPDPQLGDYLYPRRNWLLKRQAELKAAPLHDTVLSVV